MEAHTEHCGAAGRSAFTAARRQAGDRIARGIYLDTVDASTADWDRSRPPRAAPTLRSAWPPHRTTT